MAYQGINTGTTPNDGTGDTLIGGGVKINSNFSELYNLIGDGSTLAVGVVTVITAGDNVAINTSTGNVTISATTPVSIATTDVVISRNLQVSGISTLGVVTGGTYYGDGSNLTGLTGVGAGVVVQKEGSSVGTAGTLNFGAQFDATTVNAGVTTITLTDTTVSAGSYTAADITVDAQGRITAASSGVTTANVSADTLVVSGVSTFTGAIDANGSLDVDGHTELDDVNVSGVSTFTGAVDANGDLDVDGHTELDDLNVSGVSTFTGAADFNGDVDIDGHTELDNLNVSGVSTFTGAIDANGSLDVDGHTELDNVNVSGVITATTFSGITTSMISDYGNGLAGGYSDTSVDAHLNISSANSGEVLSWTGSDYDWVAQSGGSGITTANISANTLVVSGVSTLGVTSTTNSTTEQLYVSGVSTFVGAADFNGDIDVDGHTELDNLNVSGVSTFVGVTTFSGQVNISDTNIVLGESTGTNNNRVKFSTSEIFQDNASFEIIGRTSGITIRGDGSNSWTNVEGDKLYATLTEDGSVDLYHNDNKKLSTTGAGITIFGTTETQTLVVSGTSGFTGNIDVDGHTELDNLNVSGVSTFTGAVDANGDLDVDGHTELDDVNVSGVSTFAGAIDANGDLDVDGHTELDNVNVSGVSTFNNNVTLTGNTSIVFGNTNRQIQSSGSALVISTNGAENVTIVANNGGGSDGDVQLETTVGGRVNLTGTGGVGIYHTDTAKKFETTASGIDVTGHTETDTLNVSGVSTFTGNSTFNGNVSIAGTLTYDDVTNVDSIGIITARSGVVVSSGGINVTGVSTLGTVKISSGIVTATSGVVTYYGDGSNLTGIVTGIEAGSNITILESPTGNFIITSTSSGGSGITTANISADTLVVSGVTTISSLTGAGAIVFSNSGGILSDSANLTYGSDTLTSTKVRASVSLRVEGNSPTGAGTTISRGGVISTGIVTAKALEGDLSNAITSRWTLGASGSNHYTFTGPGGLSNTNDPVIYLARGQSYEFVNNMGAHPFQIRQSNGGSAYNSGVSNNGASSGIVTFAVPFDAPNTLYYQCTSHSGMGGTVVVYPNLFTV
jgi:plastocyanin